MDKELSIFPIEQPPPQDGGIPVGSVVRSLFKQILEHQEAKGLKKYGTVLKTHNGREPLVDALCELVDAVQYVVQALLELNAKWPEVEKWPSLSCDEHG